MSDRMTDRYTEVRTTSDSGGGMGVLAIVLALVAIGLIVWATSGYWYHSSTTTIIEPPVATAPPISLQAPAPPATLAPAPPPGRGADVAAGSEHA